MKVILKKAVVVVTIGMMAMLQSCSSNDDLDGYTPTNFNVGGKVEKGPFVRGTAIQMQPLDADLDETVNLLLLRLQIMRVLLLLDLNC